MPTNDDLIRRLFWKLENTFSAIEKAEEKVEYSRVCAEKMTEVVKEYLDHTGEDYSEALDNVLRYAEGDSYKSLIMVFGVTPEEKKRHQRSAEYLEKEKRRWEAYVKKCEEEGISPYITTKPHIPSFPPSPGDWTTSWGNGAP